SGNRREKLLELRSRNRSLVEQLRLQHRGAPNLEPRMAHAPAQRSRLAARQHSSPMGRTSKTIAQRSLAGARRLYLGHQLSKGRKYRRVFCPPGGATTERE